MNTKRRQTSNLNKKRLRNKNYITRSKLRHDIKLNGAENVENDYFISPLHKNERCFIKNKNNPLPMKFRSLPQSFWEQPNKTSNISTCVDDDDLNNDNLKNDSDATYKKNYSKINEEIISDANTDLLFSLFKSVEDEQMLENKNNKRKRKKKHSSKVIRDDDPYLASNITENLLPFIPVRNKVENIQQQQQQQVLLRNSSCSDSSSIINCGLNGFHNNYSQILSQLVVQL